jgi:hypothetical protein
MMLDIDARQSAFAMAILHPEYPIPPGLTGPDGEPSARRFAVYRNNVVAGLCDALKAAYPATRRIVGDEFVGAFEPAQALPYLRDVARLERAWAQAYHAREATSLGAKAFKRIAPGQLSTITFVLHPSVRIVRSPFPVVTIWQMNIEGGVPAAVDSEAAGEDAVVVRPVAEVEVRALPRGGASFIEALHTGARMIDALESALVDEPSFDLGGTLKVLIEAGALSGTVARLA